jgi:hypothetical protein
VSSEIERRLEQLLTELPEPDHDVTERVLARTLEALPVRETRLRRRVGSVAITLAGAFALLAIAAGALAAAGALHVSIGRSPRPARTPNSATRAGLSLPSGAGGIAAVINGRLWLTTSNGMRLQGLPVSAAALSPHALYVAAGIGDSLVAMAPDGRQAWSSPVAGTVRAIAWAPDGLRIAYIVQNGTHFRLHVIVGNGSDDQLIDKRVRPVQPSWRADSLAFAYVGGGGGKPIIYDLGHRSRRVITSASARDATRLAFSPTGRALAIGTRNGFLLTDAGARSNGGIFQSAVVAGLGWLDGQIAVAVNPTSPGHQGPFVQLFQLDHGEAIPMGQLIPPAPIKALDTNDRQLTVAVALPSGVRVLASSPERPIKRESLPASQLVLSVPSPSRISALAVR